MKLSITALNSGSNGNCYYIGNEEEAILVDAGISCRETEKRLKRLGLSMSRVKAIFISHEHSDHIRGISVLAKKYHLPVYITPGTLGNARVSLSRTLVLPFTALEPVQVGQFSITAFPKWHDAADPHSFIVSCGGVNVGVFTDIGVPCEQLISHFARCHAAILEANYDEEMLEQGPYPYFLKKRITGGHGHLSNKQALDVFLTHRPSYMSHLFLAHLSKDNNCPELVKRIFSEKAGDTEIVVASRYAETPVYYLNCTEKPVVTKAIQGELFQENWT